MIDAAILVGGKSSRMGEDKAAMNLGGLAMVRWVAKNMAASGVLESPFLVGGEGRERFGLPVFPDSLVDKGPLGGIYGALLAARGERCLVVSCDLPFLAPAFFVGLVGIAAEDFCVQAVIPLTGGRRQTVAAIYAKSALPFLAQELVQERPKPGRILEKLRVRYLEVEEMVSWGNLEELFFNINTPEDLLRAERLVREGACFRQ